MGLTRCHLVVLMCESKSAFEPKATTLTTSKSLEHLASCDLLVEARLDDMDNVC